MKFKRKYKPFIFGGLVAFILTFFLLIIIISSVISLIVILDEKAKDKNEEALIEGLPDKITMEMVEGSILSYEKYGVPASITLAQIVLESGDMSSNLVKRDHNLFGIKYFGTGKEGVDFNWYKTSEQTANGSSYSTRAKFKKFKSIKDAIDNHGQLLSSSLYTSRVKNRKSADSWADGLQGKYATDVKYASKLKSVMKQYNLYRFDGMKISDLKNLKKKASLQGVEIKSNKFQKAILKAVNSYSNPYRNGYYKLCEGWVYACYKRAGLQYSGSCCAANARARFAKKNGKIPIGAVIYSGNDYRSSCTCGNCGRNCGHVAIYIGNGKVAGSQSQYIMNLDDWVRIFDYGGWSFNVNKVK